MAVHLYWSVLQACIAALEAATKRRDTLLRCAVGEFLREHAPRRHPLNAVVANRCRRLQPLLEVARLHLHAPRRPVGRRCRGVRPHSGEAVRLELEP